MPAAARLGLWPGSVRCRLIDRTHQRNGLAGASDRHVESSFAARSVEWAEAQTVPTGFLIQSVGHAENDSIAFITLDVFQILDEEWLGTILAEERLEVGTVLSQFVQYGELLAQREGDDSRPGLFMTS